MAVVGTFVHLSDTGLQVAGIIEEALDFLHQEGVCVGHIALYIQDDRIHRVGR